MLIQNLSSYNDINPSQLQAITHRGSHLLIVAGPGTGKTHTLTHRIAYVAQELDSHQKILAITFTNKAAQEMRERLLSRLPDAKDLVMLGTFHSFCLQFLRENIHLTNLPEEFRVANTAELESLSQRLWPDRKVSQRQEILEEISRWKSTQLKNDEPPDVDLFNRALREEGMLDFDDLLRETVKLLETNAELRAQTRRLYPFVFVDEYQDINGIQRALLKILTMGAGLDVRRFNDAASSPAPRIGKHHPVFLTAIGDPNQAIYGFRGADVRFFESFQNDFPGAALLYLVENYRSAANLLKASAQVISKENSFDVPELIARIYREGRLTVHEAATDRAEAEFVVHQIEKLVGGTSLFSQDSRRVESGHEASHSFGEIAVLYRLNAQGKILEEAFRRSGIPYQIAERPLTAQPGIFEIIKILKEKSADFSMAETFEYLFRISSEKSSLSMDSRQKENIEKLKRMSLLGQSKSPDWREFFDRLSLQRPEDFLESRAERVNLMTLHASKGLEFPVVFVVGCEEHLFPLKLAGLSSNPQEERRLFYVGMTRAKERLYLIRARRRRIFGQFYENKPSLFLEDIEEQLKAYEKMHYHPSSKNKKEQEQLTLFND